MLEVLLKKIPKTSNEVVLILGLLGFFIIWLKGKKNIYLHIVLYVLLGVLIWRIVYRINSSRYASCLIYPFCISAAYCISFTIKTFSKIENKVIAIIGIALISYLLFKNFYITQINYNLGIIAELHDRLNSRSDVWTLIMQAEDLERVRKMEQYDNPFEFYNSDQTIQDVSKYITDYKTINKKVLYNIPLGSKENGFIHLDQADSKYRHVLSVYSQKNKKKRQHVYKIESNVKLLTLSNNKPIEAESGILENGDLELLDSPEQSHIKFKNHIKNYSLYYDFDESKRTPVNAYFYNGAKYTDLLPYYNCMNNKAISGKNSALIVTSGMKGSLIFYQKFYNGSYHYSVILSGKKDTTVCIFYDAYANKKWSVHSLGSYTIPSNGIFQIKTSFSVSDLNPGEYFLIGAYVVGEAYLDNFCITPTNEQSTHLSNSQ